MTDSSTTIFFFFNIYRKKSGGLTDADDELFTFGLEQESN